MDDKLFGSKSPEEKFEEEHQDKMNCTFCSGCESWTNGKRNQCPKCESENVMYFTSMEQIKEIFFYPIYGSN